MTTRIILASSPCLSVSPHCNQEEAGCSHPPSIAQLLDSSECVFGTTIINTPHETQLSCLQHCTYVDFLLPQSYRLLVISSVVAQHFVHPFSEVGSYICHRRRVPGHSRHLLFILLVLYVKTHYHTKSYTEFSPMFSSRSFIILHLTCISITRFELIVMKAVMSVSKFSFSFHTDIQLFHHLL